VFTALAYHNAQLQASAFREEFDPEAFEDLTRPKYDMIHKVRGLYPHVCVFNLILHQRAGNLMKEWKRALLTDESANVVPVTTGSKRKAVRAPVSMVRLSADRTTQDVSVDEAEIRSKHEAGALAKVGTLSNDLMQCLISTSLQLRVDQLKVSFGLPSPRSIPLISF
jgi:ATP-dependent DNA helicase 2 subunit 1